MCFAQNCYNGCKKKDINHIQDPGFHFRVALTEHVISVYSSAYLRREAEKISKNETLDTERYGKRIVFTPFPALLRENP